MLEMRTVCENCSRSLPPNAVEARICSFECTFCAECVENILKNVCPNCGGGFTPRPARPSRLLAKYPPAAPKPVKPVDFRKHQGFLESYQGLDPADR